MHPPKRARLISPPQSATKQSECLRQGTITKLSDDVLLEIFRYYLDASPRFWPRLVRICRKWRRIVFATQQSLHLRLFCTPGTPVLKTLNCWPALPIVMEYGGSLELDPPSPEDEVNIIAALKQSDRVSSISLTVTTSLLEKLYAIERPFVDLEDLVLLSRESAPLTLPSAFLGGPRLRRLHLSRTTFPALLHLLYSSRNIVDLQLHECPWYLSVEILADALSGMAQLRSLSLHIPSTTDYVSSPPPPDRRVILPALTHLKFQGNAEFLERLVVRIDTPSLGNTQVTLLDDFIFDLSNLGKFVDRIEMHRSLHQAHILSSEHAISILLTQPGTPTRFNFQLVSNLLSEQFSAVSRIAPHFLASFLNVDDLRISATQPSSQKDSLGRGRWLELISLFTGVKRLHLDGRGSTDIVCALQEAYLQPRAGLPALHKLYLPHPGPRHMPLSMSVVSLMTIRWDSGYPIGVEYERLCRISEPRGTKPFSEPVTIDGMLGDDILLNIFRQFLDSTPRLWPILTHVCRNWRQVILRSPLGLQLRLYCTHGTPVLKGLDCWPLVPLVINYGGSPMLNPPAHEDEDNIIAALKQFDRVHSISLTLTNSLTGKLSTISEPFSELEDIVLLSQDNLQLTLPIAFQWGSRLRTLHVTRIAIPALPRLLSSSTDLVDLQLHEIPMAGYFPPQAFVNVLSGVSDLQSLSLHFLSFPPRRSYTTLPPSDGHRIVLPALTYFKYRGISKYLDSFVARIDAPQLGVIDVTLFNQPTMDASQLGQFIERIGMHESFTEAEIRTSVHAVSISFKNSSTSTPLRLHIPCKQLDWQLSSIIQVCDQLSPFIFGVKLLVLNTNDWSRGKDDVDGGQWLQLFRSFSSARTVSVAGELTTDILCTLRPANERPGYMTDTALLPALRNLFLRNFMPFDRPHWDAAQSLITSRGLSGRPVKLQFVCDDCNADFSLRDFNDHLISVHAYEIVCSYCVDFRLNIRDIHRFQEHLRRNHPEVARNDELIYQSHSTLSLLQRETLANRHCSLRKKRRPFRLSQYRIPDN